jgi:hypothetical protein
MHGVDQRRDVFPFGLGARKSGLLFPRIPIKRQSPRICRVLRCIHHFSRARCASSPLPSGLSMVPSTSPSTALSDGSVMIG